MNPISLRRTLKMICVAVVCAALPACAGNRTTSQRGRSPEPLNCRGLKSAASSYPILNGDRDTTIEYPQHKGRIAVLKVPKGSVPANTRFTIESSDSEHVQINIEAKDEAGNPRTGFSGQPLALTVFVYDVCKPHRPEPGKSFYLYRIPVDSTTVLGSYEDPPFWKFWKKTSRVNADLDHLSGYILAQGLR